MQQQAPIRGMAEQGAAEHPEQRGERSRTERAAAGGEGLPFRRGQDCGGTAGAGCRPQRLGIESERRDVAQRVFPPVP
jgi:hypothetical protein